MSYQEQYEKMVEGIKPHIREFLKIHLEDATLTEQGHNAHQMMLKAFTDPGDYLDALCMGVELMVVQYAETGAYYVAKAVQDIENEQTHIDGLFAYAFLGWYVATRKRLDEEGVEYTVDDIMARLDANIRPLVSKVAEVALKKDKAKGAHSILSSLPENTENN